MTFWTAAFTLWQRELIRFYRYPSRVVGAVGTALLFWIFAAGIGGSHAFIYIFPGAVVMSVMFTCIFSNASIIEDKQAGFLQSVMVAPVSRGAIVMGKILGGATLSTLQGLVILVFAWTVGATFQFLPFLGVIVSLFLLSFVLNGMGFWLAWKLESSPGFHTIMNMVLLPMWMASGSIPTVGSSWLKVFMKVNPFTYGVAGVRRGLFPTDDLSQVPSFGVCILFLVLAGALFYFFSSLIVSKTGGKK